MDPGGIPHGFDAPGLLALTNMLYGHSPEAIVFTITAASFDLKETLSSEVESAFPSLLEKIRDWVGEAVD
jgi:Ni,Fe-hydrogenase maturation factor